MATLVVPKSPISVIFFIHKAICNELGVLHQLAMGYAMGTHADVGAFLERCNFLKSIYDNYFNFKDEAIFAAVYTREKNMAPTYLLEHIGERTAFDHLFKLLISSTQNGESFPTELVFLIAALQTFVAQCMAKEEDQVFPLLAQFSHEEQASLVWKILCSIPNNILSKFLPWLSSSISPDEYHYLQKYLRNIVREDNLVEQVIFAWKEGKDYCASMISNQTDETDFASEFSGEHPVDTVILWHNAIKRELHEILEEAKKISISGAVTYDLLAFHKKLQFIAEICIFHSVAETKVMYPAVYGETLSFQQRTKEESLCKEFMCLIESIQKAGTISSSITEFNSTIASHADRIMETLKGRFNNEEVQAVFAAVYTREENMAPTYLLQHIGERTAFDHLFKLLISSTQNGESFPTELVFLTAALQTFVAQCMAKEEDQQRTKEESLCKEFMCLIESIQKAGTISSSITEFNSTIASHADRIMETLKGRFNNEEVQAVFAAVYTREENMAPTYLLQHIGERTAFDHLFKLLISSTQNGESFPTELVFLTAALQTFVAQCMAKEEDQVFPLLAQFSHEEQASLVWKILCSIPNNILSKFLPWLSSSISPDEYHYLQKYLRNIVREDNLVEQVIFAWKEGKDYCASMISNQTDETDFASEFSGEHPVDTVILWHNAIKRELHEILEEAKKISISGAVTYDLLAFHKKLQFIAEICIFHSVAETKVMYPAVYGETLSFQQRTKEESLCKEFMCLIESIQKAGTISSSITEFNSTIASHADRIMETLKGRFNNEEVQVLPLVRKHLSVKRQRELLHQSLCVMPLKLIERALPWMVNSLTANEANNFVKNMQLAAPASDIALVEIFCGWASKPLNDSSCSSASGRCPVKRFVSSDEKIGQLSRAWCASTLSSRDIYSSPYQESNASHPLQPIDVVFKAHKAIRRDLEYLDNESEKVSTCDEIFLQQFSGFFCFLWDLSRAHSNAEDSVVYPALESRDALHNVSHSYTLDHEQEQQAFENISGLLFELSHLHGSAIAFSGTRGGESSECLRKYHELAIRLRVSLKSLRIMVDQHMTREEIELWPLFGLHFSVEDQNKMVGFILGTTGADVLQSMLPWVSSALTEDEQSEMMNTFNQVTKNTMFNEWLNESSNGKSFSSSQTRRLETRISPKGSVRQIDRAFNSHKKHNLKNLMSSYWMAAQQSVPRASAGNNCEGEDLVGRSPTFQDSEKGVYGCKHYKRNCKLHATCCNKLFTCRFCHDIGSDHKMDWKQTSEMMCMRCLNIQPVGPICSTPSCSGLSMAKYYCNSCKLFDDGRNVYHCPFCNLCRVGKGLGIDYFHCMKCNCCLSISIVNHKCREKCLEANCPICNDFLFTSTSSIRALPCGHLMHVVCLEAFSRSHYSTCPVCCKSSGNMMRASTQSSILVGGDESMEFSDCHERTQMKTSWTNKKLEGTFSSLASFLVNMLYHCVLWFELHTGEHPRLLQRLKKGLENAVAGQNAKERFLMCFLVLCILVLFCGLIILLWFKALGSNKYSYL